MSSVDSYGHGHDGLEMSHIPPYVPDSAGALSGTGSPHGPDLSAVFARIPSSSSSSSSSAASSSSSSIGFSHSASSMSSEVAATISGAVRPVGGHPDSSGDSKRARAESDDRGYGLGLDPSRTEIRGAVRHATPPESHPPDRGTSSRSGTSTVAASFTPERPGSGSAPPLPIRPADRVISGLRSDLESARKDQNTMRAIGEATENRNRKILYLLAAVVAIVGICLISGGLVVPGVVCLALSATVAFALFSTINDDLYAEINKKKVNEEYNAKKMNDAYLKDMAEILPGFDIRDPKTGAYESVLDSPKKRDIISDESLYKLYKNSAKPRDAEGLKIWRDVIEEYLMETYGLEPSASGPPVSRREDDSRPLLHTPPPPPPPEPPITPPPPTPPPTVSAVPSSEYEFVPLSDRSAPLSAPIYSPPPPSTKSMEEEMDELGIDLGEVGVRALEAEEAAKKAADLERALDEFEEKEGFRPPFDPRTFEPL